MDWSSSFALRIKRNVGAYELRQTFKYTNPPAYTAIVCAKARTIYQYIDRVNLCTRY